MEMLSRSTKQIRPLVFILEKQRSRDLALKFHEAFYSWKHSTFPEADGITDLVYRQYGRTFHAIESLENGPDQDLLDSLDSDISSALTKLCDGLELLKIRLKWKEHEMNTWYFRQWKLRAVIWKKVEKGVPMALQVFLSLSHVNSKFCLFYF
jgi:hypothetical protein